MQEVGAETLGGLAYYFETFQEALDGVGRAVADAWMAARQSVQRGLASHVRPLCRAEAVGAQTAVAARPAQHVASAPAARSSRSTTSRASRFEMPEAEEVEAQLVDTLVIILHECGKYRTTDPSKYAHLVQLAKTVAGRSEPATTLRCAAATWPEVRQGS